MKMTKEKLSPNFFKTNKKEVEYRWQRNDVVDGYPGLHITIPVPKEKLELMFELERVMRELGIVFDSGYGEGCRDWEFDWSCILYSMKKTRNMKKL
ncbi:hypothetical protein KAW18_12790 [candidate division WOR-3 bacterium]|nr:hypothetical protein [candidate division WOR-3 bacterium]